MGGFRMLAGEKEELRLKPSPAGWWPNYLAALWFALVGLALFLLTLLPGWDGYARVLDHDGTSVTGLDALWSTAFALAMLGGALLVGAGFVQRSRRARNDHLVLSIVAALAVAGVAAFATPALADPPRADIQAHCQAVPRNQSTTCTLWSDRAAVATWLVPGSLWVASLLGLAWAELRRLTTTIHITNVRSVVHTSIPPREHAIHHADLADIDRKRSGPGGAAHLHLVPRQGDILRLRGIAQPEQVADLIALLAQRATATEYLRKTQELDARILDAVAAFHRKA